MARKKREIQKRKKQVDSGTDNVHAAQGAGTGSDLSGFADAGHVKVQEPDRGKMQETPKTAEKIVSTVDPGAVVKDNWFSKNKENLLLGLLVIYVILLGLGTVGELFEIEWILNLPLFK